MRASVWTCCCSSWSLLIWDFVLLRFHIWRLWGKKCKENMGKYEKEDLRKAAPLVILLCLACSPVALFCHLVMIIRLFRVILKPNHCCDMPVMLPEPVAQQFKPQRGFSGYFLDCSGVIWDLFQIMGVAFYYMTKLLIFCVVQDLVTWKEVSYSSPRTGKTLRMPNIS